MKRFAIFGAALVFSAGTMFMLSGPTARAQEHMDKNAQFCEDFDQNVIIGGKLDEASKYLTNDFKEHNLRLTADGLEAFTAKLKAMRANAAGRGGGRGRGGRGGGGAAPHRTVLSEGNIVVFITPQPERNDPNNPGRKIPASTHFDVYRLENGKIAEHWD
jgi:predicted SnoaL-like aldol condensation-catalyzing enzyme